MRAIGSMLLLAGTAVTTVAAVDFVREVRPILDARCGSCHAAAVASSGFSIATAGTIRAGGKKHGRAVVGGQPDASPLVQMIRGTITPKMPMGAALPAAEVATLEAWVRELPAEAATAKPAWRWPYEPPAKPPVPLLPGSAVKHPIELFANAYGLPTDPS